MTLHTVERNLESRMLGNLRVRFGVGGGVQLPALHHPSNSPKGVAPKAAPTTAARGGIKGIRAENPFFANTQHVLENKAHEGSGRQEMAPLRKPPKLPKRRTRGSNPQPVTRQLISSQPAHHSHILRNECNSIHRA